MTCQIRASGSNYFLTKVQILPEKPLHFNANRQTRITELGFVSNSPRNNEILNVSWFLFFFTRKWILFKKTFLVLSKLVIFLAKHVNFALSFKKKNKQAEIARGSSSPKQPLIRFDRKQVINVTLWIILCCPTETFLTRLFHWELITLFSCRNFWIRNLTLAHELATWASDLCIKISPFKYIFYSHWE